MSGLDWYVIAAPVAVAVLALGLGLLSAFVVRRERLVDQMDDQLAEVTEERDQLQARLDTYRGLAADRLDPAPGPLPQRRPHHPGEDC